MQSEVARGEDGAPGMTRRGVRLLVLLGIVVAAYLALSLFDHAARADSGSINQIGATDPLTPAKATAAAGKSLSKLKPAAPKAHRPKTHRPTIKTTEVHSPKIQASEKIHTPKTPEPRNTRATTIRTGETA